MTAKSPFLSYGRQSISTEDIRAVTKALKKPLITRGEQGEAFEKAIADYCGAAHAVAFSSGSAALAAAMYAAEISAHDRILTTPNTFISTVGTAVDRGATPIFVDIDRLSGNIDAELAIENLNPDLSRGRLVFLPVHFAGIAIDMKAITERIEHRDTVVIEDAAHALGSWYPSGERVGSCAYSDLTIFSFHPLKNITTGEGGMVTTPHEEMARRLRKFRNNGIERDPQFLHLPNQGPWYYEAQDLSNNFHLTEFQAALGLSQLERLDSFIRRRRELVRKYRERLQDLEGVILFSADADPRTAYHLFVVQVDFAAKKTSRTRVMEQLMEKGVGAQVHYIPLYRHPVFSQRMGDLSHYFPQMEAYFAQALSLPIYYELKDSELDLVCEALRDSFRTA